MSQLFKAAALAGAFFFAAIAGANAQTPISSLSGNSSGLLESVQWGGGGYCERLRYACIYKERLGEEGLGNCRRYHRECGGGGYEYYRHCERLRNACIYKESRGEVGEGNCRRYREECRGRW